mmetsp:Transcript_5308/g.19977  ORF Transcript_5308/g.19977 Transcript_5308/m.19977 type:complete len:249 (+) Transcript_5308:138-884(+)
MVGHCLESGDWIQGSAKTPDCPCEIHHGLNMLMLNAILDKDMWEATRKACPSGSLSCPKPNRAPVCETISSAPLVPGSDHISTFGLADALSKDHWPFAMHDCPFAPMAACMTAPLQGPTALRRTLPGPEREPVRSRLGHGRFWLQAANRRSTARVATPFWSRTRTSAISARAWPLLASGSHLHRNRPLREDARDPSAHRCVGALREPEEELLVGRPSLWRPPTASSATSLVRRASRPEPPHPSSPCPF